MGVTVINQSTTATERTNWIVGWLIKLTQTTVHPSTVPYPHNALQSKPWAFEWSYNVSVSRPQFDGFLSSWSDQEHWSPLYIKRNASKSKRVIIYYHGGGFVNEMVTPQWNMLGRLGRELDADVFIQTYIMAPHGGIQENLDRLIWSYEQVRKMAKQQGQELILFGDSAGGCITASMLLALNDRNISLPDQALLLSPCLTMSFETPENRALEPFDPVLTVDKFSAALHGWATGPIDKELVFKPVGPLTDDDKRKMEHPYAAPLYGDWRFLAEKKVPLTICQGTYDILLPQCDKFVENAKSLDLDLTYIRADKAAHDYPLMADMPFAGWLAPDSIRGLELMVESVKRYSDAH